MKLAGSGSWRLEEDCTPQALHTALQIRDAVGLPVSAAADIPPPLLAEYVVPLADRPGPAVPPGSLMTAGQDWARWWRKLVALRVAQARPENRPGPALEDFGAWAEAQTRRTEAVFDPPQFAALDGSARLQAAAQAVWASRDRGAALEPEIRPDGRIAPGFEWAPMNEIVRAVAASRGVPMSQLDACLVILRVDGLWSHVAAPGFALCSAAVTTDVAAARTLLTDVFGSCTA